VDRRRPTHGARCEVPPGPFRLEPLEPRRNPTIASGAEFLVNTETASTQQADTPVAIASDDDGNFVVVWDSYGQDAALTWGVYGQRFAPDGTPLGAEFLINATFLSDQQGAAVAMNGSGEFVVAWDGEGVLGLLFPGIYVRRYDASGNPLGTEVGVAETFPGGAPGATA